MQAARIAECAGFAVAGPSGVVGWVEEVWLDAAYEVAGVAIEMLDGRRGFLPRTEIADVSSDRLVVTMRGGARLLQLELPRLTTLGAGADAPIAIWQTTDARVELPDPAGQVLEAPPSATPTPDGQGRPLWQVVAGVYAFLAVLVTALIGVDFLIAYLVTGAPPY